MNKMIYAIIMLAAVSVFARIDYMIPYNVVTPQIDGVLQSGEWDDALAVPVGYDAFVTNGEGTDLLNSTPSASDISATYYFKWDETYLYMAFAVVDDTLVWRNNYPGPYNGQDVVQICFNPNDNAAATFTSDAWILDVAAETANAYGADIYRHTMDLPVDPNLVVSEIGDGYVIEAAVEWQYLIYRDAAAGDSHGLGLMIVDVDATSAESLLTDFGDGQNVIATPTAWNRMYLVDENGCGSQGKFASDLDSDCYVGLLDFKLMADDWLSSTF